MRASVFAHPDVAVAVNLPQRLKARLFDQQLRLHPRARVNHGTSLFCDIDGVALAGELT